MVRSTLALAAVLSVASISIAGDLVTPPVFVGTGSDASCNLVNITSDTISARLQLIIDDGTVLVDSTQTVPPGQVVRIFGQKPGRFVYCRFVKASKGKVRATLAASPDSGDSTATAIAVAQ